MANKTTNQGKHNTQDPFSTTCSSVISGVITVGIVLLFTLFPLILHDSYFDILETKYRCYYMITLAMLALCLILGLVMMGIDLKEYGGAHTRKLFGRLLPGNWRRTFCPADAAVLVFWLVCLISTLHSEYLYESFWGNEGRYSGLFLITLYVSTYFLISRFWKAKTNCLELFLISGLLLSLFGITDYFKMDIFQFREHVNEVQKTDFTSTLGNINTYTAYLGMLVGFSGMMFATAESRRKTVWYYICYVIFLFAIIMGISDNAYLGIAALLGLMPMILLKKDRTTLRYLILTATFFSVIWCIAGINVKFAGTVVGIESLFRVIAGQKLLPAVIVLLWAAAAVFYLYRKRYPGSYDRIGRYVSWAWLVLVIAVVGGVMALFAYANQDGNQNQFGTMSKYLVFDDDWGTMRGYVWRRAWIFWKNFPLVTKIVGYGPDTFGILTVKRVYNDMISSTGQLFDNAHNEYLQYLVTTGAAGLLSYVTFLAAALARVIKNRNFNLYCAGIAGGVLCYAIQATVNLNLPIATPVMWLLLSVGMALSRKKTTA